MTTVTARTWHPSRPSHPSWIARGIRGAGHATLGWLRRGQLGPADVHDIWSHPAGQWRF